MRKDAWKRDNRRVADKFVGSALMRSTLVGGLIALAVTTANAAWNATSAGSMLPHCKASLDYPPGTFIQGFCAGMVVGVAAVAQPIFAPGQSRASERCANIPEGTRPR